MGKIKIGEQAFTIEGQKVNVVDIIEKGFLYQHIFNSCNLGDQDYDDMDESSFHCNHNCQKCEMNDGVISETIYFAKDLFLTTPLHKFEGIIEDKHKVIKSLSDKIVELETKVGVIAEVINELEKEKSQLLSFKSKHKNVNQLYMLSSNTWEFAVYFNFWEIKIEEKSNHHIDWKRFRLDLEKDYFTSSSFSSDKRVLFFTNKSDAISFVKDFILKKFRLEDKPKTSNQVNSIIEKYKKLEHAVAMYVRKDEDFVKQFDSLMNKYKAELDFFKQKELDEKLADLEKEKEALLNKK